jgi:hypothetical protein
VYGPDTVRRTIELARAGKTQAQIQHEAGIPARTLGRWLSGQIPGRNRLPPDSGAQAIPRGGDAAYAYLLGLYLGDGHIARLPRTFDLRITLDSRYPGIAVRASQAIQQVLPDNTVRVVPHSTSNALIVRCYSRLWPTLFPQLGPGRKHERRIELADWQANLTSCHPRELIRGLIHSDGCRFLARQPRHGRVYIYPRYCFRNYSAGILRIFCRHLDLIGVEWTRSNDTTIQVARRESVAALDIFVGPKG